MSILTKYMSNISGNLLQESLIHISTSLETTLGLKANQKLNHVKCAANNLTISLFR